MGILHQLTLVAFGATKRQSLVFTILNDTIKLIPYERAVLWETKEDLSLLGVSGQATIAPQTPLAQAWKNTLLHLNRPVEACRIEPLTQDIPDDLWKSATGDRKDLQVLWIPLPNADVGLWLERLPQYPWTDAEIQLLGVLAQGYALAWRRQPEPPLKQWLGPRRKRLRRMGLIALIAFLSLFLLTIPLRVVAPCEIVAADPYLVTAPLTGVIQSIEVQPGQEVLPGDLLFLYDPRVARQELEVAIQQVGIVQSQLDRATVLALQKEGTEDELRILRERIEQERARLKLARYRVERLRVVSPVAGIVQLSNPGTWRGKPVRVGERILTIIDPSKTRLAIWLPEEDNVPELSEHEVNVFLHSAPSQAYTARISFLANATSSSPDGVPSFLAEAEWKGAPPELHLGLEGTSILYGEKVSIAYWIFRKPMARIRATLGW